jgi:hypothetical protein
MAQEVMNQLEGELGRQVNPLEGLLRIGSDLTQPVSIRVQCMAEALPYLYPKLQSQSLAVTRDDDPADTTNVDITSIILADPSLCDAAQRLAIAMSAQEPAPARTCGPADEPRALLPAGYDPSEPPARDHNGHYLPK